MSEKIYLMGDIHGAFQPIRDFHLRHNCNKEYNESNKTIILLGDSGLNYFFNSRDEKTKAKLGKYPFTYFVIRGNHEERPSICAEKYPDKWHKEIFWGWWVWVENDYPYIKYAMDYVAFYSIPYMESSDTLEPICLKTLVIPGAYSVDKYFRLQVGYSWFPQEQLSESERLAGLSLIEQQGWKCDLVLSHTCPVMYEPTDLFLSVVDQSMVDKTMERYLGQIEYQLDYKAWMWGHYHEFRDYPRPDDRYRIMLFNDAAIDLKDYMEGKVEKL